MIRKTAFLVTGTVTGLVAVLGYNPPELNNALAAPAANQPTPTDSPTPPPKSANTPKVKSTESASQSPKVKKSKAATQTSAAATPEASNTPTKSAGVSGTFKGDTSQTRWGPVQVEITLSDGKITDVSALQYPYGDRRSQMISAQVIPWLQQETLQVQSANISGISGATYTSMGFQASLASALQKAGL